MRRFIMKIQIYFLEKNLVLFHNCILRTLRHKKKECSVACHSSKKIFAMENALRKAYKYNLGICIPFEEYGIRDYRKT
jgi:hypothetical protein